MSTTPSGGVPSPSPPGWPRPRSTPPPTRRNASPIPARWTGCPAIGAVTNLQTQGVFKDVFVRGESFNGQAPALIDPAEIDDGAVVSGQFGHPSLRNPTWVHQNHPVANALRARHGQDLAFAGVVLSPEPVSASEKARISAAAAQVCADAGFEAVILTKEGGGNADADVALKMDALEDMGIATVGLFAEMAGPDGTGPPIVVAPERATAMVSTGNYDTRLDLPEMERALGGEELALLGVPATSAMQLPTAVILASLGCLGGGRLTCALRRLQQPMARIVHYLNQFFIGAGGEDAAAQPPSSQPGPVGPGRRLAQLLGDEHEIVATVSCGDDDAAGRPEAIAEIVALIQAAEPDLVVAGPAFTSGRYGLACARVAAAAKAAGLNAVAAMHPDNPGIDEAGGAPVVASGEAARLMGPALDTLSAAVQKLLAGEVLTNADGLVGLAPRQPRMADRTAAERAVDLVLARLAGDRDATEVPLPRFDKVTPAPPGQGPGQRHPGHPHRGRPRPRRQPRRPGVGPGHQVAALLPRRPRRAHTRRVALGPRRLLDGVGQRRPSPHPPPRRRPPARARRRHRPPPRGVPGHRRQRHVGGQRPPLRRGMGRRPAPLRRPGRHPHRHLRNGHALRGNAGKGAGTGRDPDRPALQPDLDRRAGGRAPHRADPGHPLPRRRPVAGAGGGAGLAPATARAGAGSGVRPPSTNPPFSR